MATLVRLSVVPHNLDPLGPETVTANWGVIPLEAATATRLFDEWVVSLGGELYAPVPHTRLEVVGPADDFEENHIFADGGLGPKGSL